MSQDRLMFDRTESGGQKLGVDLVGAGGQFDGKARARVTFRFTAGGFWLLSVRPHGGREYDMPLEKVAEMVISRVVKNELAEQGVSRARRRL